ncbi:tail fiber protein [Galbibacter pacificus]|uniref:Tail fiber protein n=1 Tax=Galbibacter pacificus TaxID=2996052 RepID=A0ABT6FN97_9FLAO|nr:tail fiber protein [Galbibacter pacificus]MDG3581257.1 tail fiber protein [Galbibacter pacificus]MDG3584735.1 tail fiber protein [Galbibacter pacificus]
MKYNHLLCNIIMLLCLNSAMSQIQTGVYKTTPGNTDYHQFVRNGNGAAVYINQVSSNAAHPILKLSSGTSQANRNVKLIVENNGFLGIGTEQATSNLHVSSGIDGDAIILLESDTDNSNEADNPMIKFRQDGDIIGVNMGFSTNFGENLFGIGVRNTTNGGEIWDTFIVDVTRNRIGIGTNNPDSKLTVKGNIHAQELKLNLNGSVAPDYVFNDGYDLKTLEEVELHIREKGHLPNIPSAEEMEEEGINLKEMNLKLLEKIEELTLYTIEHKKLIREQGNMIIDLKNEIHELKSGKND